MSLNGLSGKVFQEKMNGTYRENAKTKEETNGKENRSFAEVLEQYEEFVENRIKEGPPKIQIGGEEYSQEEWDRLLKRVDKDIDAYKEELRERIRKEQEEAALKRATGSAAEEFI